MSKTVHNDKLPVRIAAAVRDNTSLSRADLARLLKVSPATISRVVDQLIKHNIIFEEGLSQGRNIGRPSTLLRFNPVIASILAVDLRLTEAYVARIDLDGKVLFRTSELLDVKNSEKSINKLIKLLHDQARVIPAIPPVKAIVVGAPSIVNPERGLVEWAPSLMWSNVPLGEMIESEFRLPVLIENDVNLAALGEFWKGSARGSKNNVFVSVGSGIGAGIILNRNLYHGSTFAAGEVSYFITDLETLRDEAGSIGNLEMRIALEGTLRRTQLLAQRYPASRLAELISQKSHYLQIREIFKLANEGDPAAMVVFNETVDLLTVVFCNLSVVLDPEIMVLGGPSDWQWELIVEAIQKRIGSSLLRPVNIVPSILGRDVVILGAAYIAIELDDVLPVNNNAGEILNGKTFHRIAH